MSQIHEDRDERRHEEFLARHLARHSKIECSSKESAPNNSSETSFWEKFNRDISEIETVLNELNSTSAAIAQKQLDELVFKAQQLQDYAADATSFLPSYDTRRAGEKIAKVKTDIDDARTLLIPRKKFSFKSKPVKIQAKRIITPKATEEPDLLKFAPELCSIRCLIKRVGITFRSSLEREGSGNAESSDFNCQDLENCTILVDEVFGAVRLRNSVNCKFLIGPVRGSVYVENCKNCLIMVACRQLRVHTTYDSDIYAYTMSGPIIEACSNLRFAPYHLRYSNIHDHFLKAGLQMYHLGPIRDNSEFIQKENVDIEAPNRDHFHPKQGESVLASNHSSSNQDYSVNDMENSELNLSNSEAWKDVKDFLWHKQSQSPNWSILPEDERLKSILVEGCHDVYIANV